MRIVDFRMLPVTTSGSTALAILQQGESRTRPDTSPLDVLAVANGVKPSREAGSEAGTAPVDDMFSAMSVDVNKIRVNLMERLGEKLGISLDDFEDASDFGRAVERIVDQIRLREDGDIAIMRIEHELGLDKLGVSLDELVDSIIDPESRAADKLNEALLREAGGDAEGNQEQGPRRPVIDEIGLYSF